MIFNFIQRRTSVRTFMEKPLAKSDLTNINNILAKVNNEKGPNGNKIKFLLLDTAPNGDGNIVGTYGFIRNAQAYIAGTIPNDKRALEDYGYLLEKIVIKLVEEGLGSCWLGGTFKRDDFIEPLALNNEQIIPAVLPIGYPVVNRRNAEQAMRFIIKADKRMKWTALFFNKNFDNGLTSGDLHEDNSVLLSAFESVRLGPSASNKQPWRLVLDKENNQVHFYLDENPKYSGNKMGFSMQRLDIGIAMYHFQSVADENGFAGKWNNQIPDISIPESNYKYVKTFSW